MASTNNREEIINLFEYQNKESTSAPLDEIEGFLDDVWKKREVNAFFGDKRVSKSEKQNFIQCFYRTNEIKSSKYVGCIQYNGTRINLLPKIFYNPSKDYSHVETTQIQNHILWWLSYCQRIKFPNYQASMDGAKSDFFEVLIYLFAQYTRSLLSSYIFQQYEEVTHEMPFIKGRLNTTKYTQRHLSTGQWHKLDCTFETFSIDNTFNRIVKYVTTLLFQLTNNSDNKKNLREILFILDEVTEVKATSEQCASIRFNPMMSAFEVVRDYCQLFLSNCISFDFKNELKLFAFLLPMEYVFEDFIYGFIDREIKSIKAKAQRSDVNLDEMGLFAMRPDLFLRLDKKSVIADTKYKIAYSDEKDPKGGVSQSDLYQMLAYSVRFNVDEILLFYPNTYTENQEKSGNLLIKDRLANEKEILIKMYQLPIMNRDLIGKPVDQHVYLSDLFTSTKEQLKARLEEIFC